MQGTSNIRLLLLIFVLSFVVLSFIGLAVIEQQTQPATTSTDQVQEATPTALPKKSFLPENSYHNPFELADKQITYPVSQLNNCIDDKNCFDYCATAKNTPACWSYGTFILNKNVLGVATSSAVVKETVVNCDADLTCKSYCQSNPNDCPGFASTSGSGNFASVYLGPSGCRTQEECQFYCQAHPSACPGFVPSPQSATSSSQPIPYYQLPYESPLYKTPVSESPDQAQ